MPTILLQVTYLCTWHSAGVQEVVAPVSIDISSLRGEESAQDSPLKRSRFVSSNLGYF